MVLRPEPLYASVEPLREAGAAVILLDPAGERFTDTIARQLAALPHLALVCGRYEGIDDRVRLAGRPRDLHWRLRAHRRRAAGARPHRRGGTARARGHRGGVARGRLLCGGPARVSRSTPGPSVPRRATCPRSSSPATTERSTAGGARRRCAAPWSGARISWVRAADRRRARRASAWPHGGGSLRREARACRSLRAAAILRLAAAASGRVRVSPCRATADKPRRTPR